MADSLRHVDLCSGIGGFALGFQWAGLSEPVLFCDIEAWSREVLAKHWPDVPIAHDVKELARDPRRLVPDCDILTAGYPCQPFSVAGQQRGAADDRHIWPEIFTIVQAKRPRWCVFENVSGHISLGLDQVLSDLEGEAGYEVQPFVIPACAVDAPHRRDRVWIIAAHADSDSKSNGTEHEQWMETAAVVGDTNRTGCKEPHNNRRISNRVQHEFSHSDRTLASCHVADTNGAGQQQSDQALARGPSEQLNGSGVQPGKAVADTSSGQCEGRSQRQVYGQRHLQEQPGRGSTDKTDRRSVERRLGGTLHDGLPAWMDEPDDIPRTVEGVKGRAARLKGLGNAIVPQIAMQIGLTIRAVEGG